MVGWRCCNIDSIVAWSRPVALRRHIGRKTAQENATNLDNAEKFSGNNGTSKCNCIWPIGLLYNVWNFFKNQKKNSFFFFLLEEPIQRIPPTNILDFFLRKIPPVGCGYQLVKTIFFWLSTKKIKVIPGFMLQGKLYLLGWEVFKTSGLQFSLFFVVTKQGKLIFISLKVARLGSVSLALALSPLTILLRLPNIGSTPWNPCPAPTARWIGAPPLPSTSFAVRFTLLAAIPPITFWRD